MDNLAEQIKKHHKGWFIIPEGTMESGYRVAMTLAFKVLDQVVLADVA